MKKIHIILLIIFLGFINTINSQETSTLLLGTWTFDYQESIRIMDTSSKIHLDSVSSVRKERIEMSYIGRTVTFNSDGSYIQTLADGHTANGTWVLSNDNQYVIITDPNGNQYRQQIETLSSTQLVLKPILDEGVTMLISKWSFVKS